MKIHLSSFIATIALIIASGLLLQRRILAVGEGTFKQTCGACHTLAEGGLWVLTWSTFIKEDPRIGY